MSERDDEGAREDNAPEPNRLDLSHDYARVVEAHMQAKGTRDVPAPPTKPPQASPDSGKSATPPSASDQKP
jgi:hypothetical protein